MASDILTRPRPMLVTLQVMFMLPSKSPQEAEAVVARAVSIGIGVAGSIVGMGVVAETATPQLLQERGLAQKPDLSGG